MWEKIVLNLLSNAFKFTLEGGIEVSLTTIAGSAELAVRDTGVGIPADELPRVFERFHRVNDARGRTHEGTGIGLALVLELAKLHGGTVSVESELGLGSTFKVSIPLGKAHLDPAHIRHPSELASTKTGAQAFVEEAMRWLPEENDGAEDATLESLRSSVRAVGGVSMRTSPVAGNARPRILWADDNADMRDYVARLLAERFEVQAAADGQAALEMARSMLKEGHPPNLVLSDIMMPRLDGFGLLSELRADPALGSVPIILLSARAGEEARIEGVTAGADDYITKPFSARELLARVDLQIRMAAFRSEAERSVRESESRFRAFTSATNDVVYCMSPDWSEMRHLQGREFIADTAEPSRTWLDKYIHPLDQKHVMAAIRQAIQSKSTFELEHRIIRADGTLGWTQSRAIPILDDRGEIIEWFGAASDVTQRKRFEEQIRLLMHEVNHRCKNMLSVVQSIARKTVASSPNDFITRFGERVRALATAQDLLVKNEWRGAEIGELVRSQLAHFGDLVGTQITLNGPKLLITAAASQTLSMVLHELGTNAGKYGALSTSGRVEIEWRLYRPESGPETFAISWRESGGPPVTAPERLGFGSTVISDIAKMSLGATVDLSFAASGLCWRLECKAEEILEEDSPHPAQSTKSHLEVNRLASA